MANDAMDAIMRQLMTPSGEQGDLFMRRLAEKELIDPSLGAGPMQGAQTGAEFLASTPGPETAPQMEMSPLMKALFSLGQGLTAAGGGRPTTVAHEALRQRRQEAAQAQLNRNYAYKERGAQANVRAGERAGDISREQSRYDAGQANADRRVQDGRDFKTSEREASQAFRERMATMPRDDPKTAAIIRADLGEISGGISNTMAQLPELLKSHSTDQIRTMFELSIARMHPDAQDEGWRMFRKYIEPDLEEFELKQRDAETDEMFDEFQMQRDALPESPVHQEQADSAARLWRGLGGAKI